MFDPLSNTKKTVDNTCSRVCWTNFEVFGNTVKHFGRGGSRTFFCWGRGWLLPWGCRINEACTPPSPPPPPNGGGTCPECLVEYSFEGLLLSEVYSVNTITVLNLMNRPKKLPPLPFLSENLVVEVNHISKVEYTHVQMCQEHVHLPT